MTQGRIESINQASQGEKSGESLANQVGQGPAKGVQTPFPDKPNRYTVPPARYHANSCIWILGYSARAEYFLQYRLSLSHVGCEYGNKRSIARCRCRLLGEPLVAITT